MTKHTPAPWRAVNRRDGTASVLRVDEVVAYIPKGWTKPEREANARLIAAAPDLLAACNDALHGLRIDAPERVDEIDALEAAIAKAEGKP